MFERKQLVPCSMRCVRMIAIVTAAMITSDSSQVKAQASPAWRLVEELRIDGNTHELTTIGPVVQSRTGNVFVTQWRDPVIRVFSSSVGRLEVPVTLQRIANGVWATVLDEDDVQSVVRYRIDR